jgi:multidrug efflux pump subunit AcrA (membrane-fusion protein)
MVVASEDIDNVKPGQRVDLRLAGCPFPDFGTLRGTVRSVSPDAVRAAAPPDQPPSPAPAGASVGYEVTVVPQATVMRSGSRRCDVRLGMDFTADVTTRIETVLRFVLRKGRFLLPS